ncbi:hypothetical protein BST41_28010 [Mycolicibacterium porcinum]|nr:hypothetical protein BST41_28010 [Mycolicibacterium porcinum]
MSEHHGTADGHLAAPASYRHGDDTVASISHADTVSALRRDGGAYQILSIDEAAGYARGGRPLPLLPLCGGLPPEVAWPYLERAVAASERDRKQ